MRIPPSLPPKEPTQPPDISQKDKDAIYLIIDAIKDVKKGSIIDQKTLGMIIENYRYLSKEYEDNKISGKILDLVTTSLFGVMTDNENSLGDMVFDYENHPDKQLPKQDFNVVITGNNFQDNLTQLEQLVPR